jgi:hypothetical protein
MLNLVVFEESEYVHVFYKGYISLVRAFILMHEFNNMNIELPTVLIFFKD